MKIAFGHTNSDLDSLSALLVVKKLYPDVQLVRSQLFHPIAQNLYMMYAEYFNFISPKDLIGEKIEEIIIVDTCTAARVKEYFDYIRDSDPAILIFDHHNAEACDILGAQLVFRQCGAITSHLTLRAMEQQIHFEPEEATIALSGIYSDTGRLIYDNVQREDFEAAAFLLDMGGSLKLVKSFLETVKEDAQILIMNRLLSVLETRTIQGNQILFSYLELEANKAGLAAVVEKIFEIQNPDAYFAIFAIPKTRTVLLICRSQKTSIDLHELLHNYGGGGHQLAASAKISNVDGLDFRAELLEKLEESLVPATRAKDIMTRKVHTAQQSMSLLDLSLFLEQYELTGVPVLNDQGKLTGYIGLREIMKGRKANNMKAPVSAYMSKPPIFSHGNITIREIERLFYKHNIGHLPIMEDDSLVGIVSRRNLLEYHKGKHGEEFESP